MVFGASEQFCAERVGHHLGVGFALGGFHDLTGEEVEELLIATLNFGYLSWVVGDGVVDELIDFAGISGFEAKFFGDGGGVFVW